jgi:hypothetical protein
MRISRFFLPILIIFLSCNNKNHRPYTLFKKQVNLTADQVALNFSVYNPEHFEMIDSVLFVVDYYATGRNIIRAYNLADGQPLKSFCRKGLDSDEIVPPISISPDYKNKSLVVNGKRDNKFNTYALSDIKNGKTPDVAFSKVNTGMSVTVLKVDSLFVANGFFDNKRIAVMDNSGNIIKKTVDYPPIATGLTDEEHYKVGGKKVFKPVGANIRGFIDLKGSKNHVFALYSGDPMKKYPQDNNVAASQILVYKWNGEPQAILNTDKDISYFVVDQDEQYLIGISYTPKPVFYKFSLKGKL